ncbi:hypothetical protein GCM10009347_39920 [Shewanella algicola]|uniref:Lipoprotein n=1 Tax=Shewanella algicola TaxID=640633 RepID=A0A9X2CFP7_9GAMM|nr:hypothetical protein [Shewanella algicola]MCL1107621.1 hypothetical protein [Shewanella algicola]GGP70850.1 hypothetical protein GCM10009347_39920 [Shewanella algicola]
MKLLTIIFIFLVVSCSSNTVDTFTSPQIQDSNVYENKSIGLTVHKPSTWEFQYPEEFIRSIYANNKKLDGIPNSTIAILKKNSPTYVNIEYKKFDINSANKSKTEILKEDLNKVFYDGFQKQVKSASLLKKPHPIVVSGVEGAKMSILTARFVESIKYPLEMEFALISSKKHGYIYKFYSNSLAPNDDETRDEINYIINNLVINIPRE